MIPKTKAEVDDTVALVSEFQTAVQRAARGPESKRFIEVTPEVFEHYMRDNTKTTPYFITGSPGVRVYVKGTREAIEKKESITTLDMVPSV